MTAIHTAALAFADAGCSVVPVRADGTKAPAVAWRQYQTTPAGKDVIDDWFASPSNGRSYGLGVITGAVSGGLEMLELEGRAVTAGLLPELVALARAAGLDELITRVLTGYAETTPSGGLHLLYRVDGRDGYRVPGNTKLARDGDRQVLIETRGEGGYVVVAPSHGAVHETGKPWALAAGEAATIPTVTAEEHAALHELCRALDAAPRADPSRDSPFTQPRASGESLEGSVSPGDDFEARTDWSEILDGWTVVHTRGNVRYWRRPGKRLGVSATTGAAEDRDRLYVFTTSTEFEAEVPYTKFGAYALLQHGGDHAAAARALHREGYGRPAPEPVRPAGSTAAPQGGQETPAVQVTAEPRTYTLTDDGNALRLIDTHAEQIRYCPERATWLHWDGHRWRWDHAGQVAEHARAVARALPETDDAQRRHRKVSLSARGLSAMMQVARTDPRAVVRLDHLDARAFEINTPAGAVDLHTGRLLPPDPGKLHARSTTVAPDFEKPPERWLRFLATTFAGEPALTTYIQRLLGVTLAGTVLEQVLPFCWGEGANGKTTLLGVIQRLLGIGDDGYAMSVSSDLLIATKQQSHPTELAQLAGARLAVTSELEDGQRFAEAKVKMLTGRDPISARFMRADFFTFRPTHSLWLLANHQPAVRAGGPALWRRLKLIPFLHVVPPEDRDPHLEDRLVDEEGPAILAWAIQGAADYFAAGVAEPASVATATAEYQRDQDSLARFVEEMCEVGNPAMQHMACKVPEMRSAYEAWCHAEGEQEMSAKGFTQALQRRFGVIGERSNSARYYRGIRLLDVSPDPSPWEADPS